MDTTRLRQDREDARTGLISDARRWLVLRVARELLRKTRALYEDRHRPAVLARAEALFIAWTDGEYSSLDVPSGERLTGVIRADDGHHVPLAGLSRGTAEELYLAMRIALVEHLATQQESLPFVMDDVLVNLDPERAPRVARSIEEVATHHQVIYLTCHREAPVNPARTIELGQDVTVRSIAEAALV